MVYLYTVPTLQNILEWIESLLEEEALIFCEDKLTFALEEAITKKRGATFQIEVTTFSRFVNRHIPQERILTSQGAVLKIASILTKIATNLQFLGKNPTAYAKAIYATIVQLRACNIQPDDLLQALQQESALKYKLHDLASIYQAYQSYLEEENCTDDNILMSLLPEAFTLANIHNKHILFVGHTAFTKQAERAIERAVQTAKKVTGIFIGGKERLYCNHAIERFKGCLSSVKEFALESCMQGAAEHLRKNIAAIVPMQMATDCVHLFEAENREQEVIAIAREMKKRIAKGARFRDCAVYVGNLQAYESCIARVFRYYAIPYFIDKKLEIVCHPLTQFILQFLNLGAEYFDPEHVDIFLSNHYLHFETEEKESYRNYLKCYANYRGGMKKPFKNLPKENMYSEKLTIFSTIRQSVLPYLDKMQGKHTGREFCSILLAFLQSQKIEESTEALAIEFDGVDRIFIENGAKKLIAFLEEIQTVLKDDLLSIEEFLQLFKQSVQSIEGVAFLPQKIDEVYVGDICASRAKSKQYVFASGLTLEIPTKQTDTGLIHDREIEKLQFYKLQIDPKIKDVNKRFKETMLLNLASFTKELFVSYPKTSNGVACKPSNILETLATIFTVDRLHTEEQAFEAIEYHPSMRAMLLQLERYRCKIENQVEPLQKLASFLQLKSAQTKAYMDRASYEEIPPVKTIENAHQVLLPKGKLSASFIEQHYTCPYKNFLERGLQLTKEIEGVVDARDMGSLLHAVLEKISLKLKEIDREALEASLPMLEQEIMQITMEQLQNSNYQFLTETEEERYKSSICKEIASYLLVAVFDSLKSGDFAIDSVEKPFSIPLKNAILTGKIDRVDKSQGSRAIRVIDYKTGTQEIKKEEYYVGKKVQLPLYLYAVQKEGEIENSSYFAAKIEYTDREKKQEFEKKLFSDRTDKNLDKAAYIRYAIALAECCYSEVMQGKIPPSPYAESCSVCSYGGICRYSVQFGVRQVKKVNKEDIATFMKGDENDA